MKVSLNIDKCRDCPHASNNAQEHDDAFSSGPAEVWWYCNKKSGGYYNHYRMIIEDPWKIDSRCPLK